MIHSTTAPGLFTNQPVTFIEGALQRLAEVQGEYTKGHDAIDAACRRYDETGDADTLKADLAAVRTPEFNAAHADGVWAHRTIEGNMAELTRRVGEARARKLLAEKAARYGVTALEAR